MVERMAREDESEFPKTIYKYRDWKSYIHRRLLYNREIYLASPADFNDPYDCRINDNFSLLDTDEKIHKYIDAANERNREKQAAMGQDVEDFREEIFNTIKNHPVKAQRKWDSTIFKEHDLRYGIFSTSSIWNSILMWGHYSANHTGFCVGINEEKIRCSKFFGQGGRVKYPKKYPEISPLDSYDIEKMFDFSYTKVKDWEYEKEYRLLRFFPGKYPNSEERIEKLDKSFFSEILVGVNFPQSDMDEMRRLAVLYEVPLFQVKMVAFEFELVRERII